MGQDTLDAHMQVRYSVESDLSYKKEDCPGCSSSRKRPHCHCSQAFVTEETVSLFDGAYKDREEELSLEVAEIIPEKKKDLEEEEEVRTNGLKEKLLTRKTF